jgi:hypothetical protein
MAEAPLAIYASETRANQLGKNITSEVFTITQAEAVKLREYYYKLESQRATSTSLIAGLVASYLGAGILAAFGTSIATAIPLETYFKALGKDFDTLALGISNSRKVKFTYKWKGGGSKGAYWLSGVIKA